MLRAWVLAMAMAVPLGARAEEAPAPVAEHRLSLTLSPIHLMLPVGKATAEFKISDTVSAAAMLAGGMAGTGHFILFQAGGQIRSWASGGFDGGVHLGAEGNVVFAYVPEGFSAVVPGVAFNVGPLVGYKFVAEKGFTFVAQAGFVFDLALTQHTSATTWEANIAPLLNLEIGWSF